VPRLYRLPGSRNETAYLGLLDDAVRGELLAEAVRVLAAGGAREVVADVDAHRVAVVAELERTGFRQLRSRVVFAPAHHGGS
jgi:hypothetical protein